MRTIYKTEVLVIARGILRSTERANHTEEFNAGFYQALDALAVALGFDGIYANGTVNHVLEAPSRQLPRHQIRDDRRR